MSLIRMVTAAFFAIAIALTGAAPAQAASARVTGAVQVRSGPGTSYRVVGQLRRGDRVNVTSCASSRRWCHVQSRHSRSGWVSSRLLDRIPGDSSRRGSVCFYGSRGYVCLGR